MNPSVLILDQNSLPCARHQCTSLAGLLQKSLPVRVRLQEDSTAGDPDLILFRSTAHQLMDGVVASYKRRWRQSRVFALLCPGTDEANEELPSVLADLDDFVACPYQDFDLCLRVKRLLQPGKRDNDPSTEHRHHTHSMIGESPAFLKTAGKIPPLAHARAPVVILGETGTGKELFARAIHYQGPRHGKPFIPVNCGALPDHLFENELFGHVKGAFTDASSNQNGLIMEAAGGTLFLDEVATLSQPAQIKLLRFLQDGECRLLGSARSMIVDVRIVAATNADLKTKVAEKVFREDLYHRLNVLSLNIPPLRERGGDVALLATHFLDHYSREQQGVKPARFSSGAIEKLMCYSWPGNVRELEAVV